MNTTNNFRNAIYLAAMLHDIGKFYQRADGCSVNNSTLSLEIKALENLYCPMYNNKTSHKHILWTAQFFKNFEKHLGKLPFISGISVDKLMRWAAIHHNPSGNEPIELIIQKADHYSSGTDRSKSEKAWQDAEEEGNWDSFKNVSMRSIFEAITLHNKEDSVWQSTYNKRLPMKTIELSMDYFPLDKDTAMVVPDYKALWKAFEYEVKFIQTDSFNVFAETMLYLLEKYTSRIPSSTQHLPDVSLYDHSKTTAAFAVCLHDFYRINKRLPTNDEKPFLLIGGDLSGIQKYIYGIIAHGAAKNLKGRSFYLQLLIDNIVQQLLKALNLFDANIIYKSGGGFFVLAPHTSETRDKLSHFEKFISTQLFEYHQTHLFLALDAVEFGENELFYDPKNPSKKHIGAVWAELLEKLSNKKSQRFKNNIASDYDVFFTPQKVNPQAKKDAITGEEIKHEALLDDWLVDDYTKQQIELGKKLKDVDYWLYAAEEIPYLKDKNPFNTIGLSSYNYFVNKNYFEDTETRNLLKSSADKLRCMAINELNFLESPQKGIDNIYGFYFYGGNKYPESADHSPKTFEELAGVVFEDAKKEKASQKPNLVRIAVLRMDVDNLGAIFRRGFSLDKRTFSRYSVLSRSLDYFFCGYINKIWENNSNYKKLTQIIYSGGDDLFIVGKWDVVINMATEIRKAFKKWTCENNEITLSAGLSFVYPKFPILKAAEMCEQEEKNAKNHRFETLEKNAIALFGFAFEWEHEFKYITNLKDQLKTYFDEKTLPEGFSSEIYNLMEQAKLVFDSQKQRYVMTNPQVVWLTAYQFKRAMKDTKNDKAKEFFEAWYQKIFTGDVTEKEKTELKHTKYHALQYLALAARWASLELR